MGRVLAATALCGVTLAAAAAAAGDASQAPPYTLAATQSCLTRLPNAVVGLPPARPPVPPVLFVYALARYAVSTWGIGQRPPRAHEQLGAWYGDESYQGIILSFFKSGRDAGASLKTLAWLYGGKLIGNVVATWDQKSTPTQSVRNTIFGCLRSDRADEHAGPERPPPPASLATFAGRWGGHTRGLTITSNGRGREFADDGCCTRVYELTF